MISIVLVVTLVLPNAKPIEHRASVPSIEECVRRGTNIAMNAANTLSPGVKITIGCEFTRQ